MPECRGRVSEGDLDMNNDEITSLLTISPEGWEARLQALLDRPTSPEAAMAAMKEASLRLQRAAEDARLILAQLPPGAWHELEKTGLDQLRARLEAYLEEKANE